MPGETTQRCPARGVGARRSFLKGKNNCAAPSRSLRKLLRRTAPSGEKCSLWNPYVAVQDHQNGMSSSWRGTRLKTTQIVTRRRDNLAPRKNARHQIRAVVWRLLQIDWAAHPETKRISDWKRSGVSCYKRPIKRCHGVRPGCSTTTFSGGRRRTPSEFFTSINQTARKMLQMVS